MEKSTENCKNFRKDCEIKSNFGQNMCPNNIKNYAIRHLNKFLYFFYFMKNFCLVLKLYNFKVQCLDFPMKIGNLASLLNCCEKQLYIYIYIHISVRALVVCVRNRRQEFPPCLTPFFSLS